jgi:hypothetical protein
MVINTLIFALKPNDHIMHESKTAPVTQNHSLSIQCLAISWNPSINWHTLSITCACKYYL